MDCLDDYLLYLLSRDASPSASPLGFDLRIKGYGTSCSIRQASRVLLHPVNIMLPPVGLIWLHPLKAQSTLFSPKSIWPGWDIPS